MIKPARFGLAGDADVRLLRIFKAVVECGGLSAAELELDLGRSTVSRHLAELERRVGFVLCRRGRGGFALTDAGQQVYAAALRLLESMDAFRGDMQSLYGDMAGPLKIGLFDKTATNPRARIAQAIREFRRVAPEAGVDIAMDTAPAIERGVIDGRFHVGITPEHRRSESLRYFALFDERMALFCGREHPLFEADHSVLRIADIQRYDYVGLAFHSPNMAATQRFGLRRRASVTDQEAVAVLVLSGCYLGFLPDHYAAEFVARGQLRRIDIADCNYGVRFVAVSSRSSAASGVVPAFVQALASAHAGR